MRTYIDFAGGVVSISTSGSTSGATVQVTPPLELLPDLSSFSAIDFELRVLSLELLDLDPGDQVKLMLETSLQNTDDAPEYWFGPDELEEGLNLSELSAPIVMSTSVTRGLLRYFRWRIAIPPHASAPPVTVKMVFQLRGYGRSA